jgi:hypothetical protein
MVSGGVMGLLTLLLWMPATSTMLHMTWLKPQELVPAGMLAGLAVLWYEVPKLLAKSA